LLREIVAVYGKRGLREFVSGSHLGVWTEERSGMYTDDTNSTLALASSLVFRQTLDAQHAAEMYGKFWLLQPERGYPDSAKIVLTAVLNRCDIRATGTFAFRDGSFANGAAMRISPIGISYRNASDSVLTQAVRLAVLSSHVHPEAVAGALVIAKAVAILCNTEPEQFKPENFLDDLISISTNDEVTKRLQLLRKFWNTPEWKGVVWCVDERMCENVTEAHMDDDYCARWFQIRSVVAVACAIWAFLTAWNDPEEAIVQAVLLGGDADTVGCMTGALVGALHGYNTLPKRWVTNLENGTCGRNFAIQVGEQLGLLDLVSVETNILETNEASTYSPQHARQEISTLLQTTTPTMFRNHNATTTIEECATVAKEHSIALAAVLQHFGVD